MCYRFLLFMIMISCNIHFALAKQSTAIFAGGNFWYLQADFNNLPGVVYTLTGFDGGKTKFPTFALVSSGRTKYAQSVKVTFDDDKLSYARLVEYFFSHIDPTSKDGQFCDYGSQFRTVIFYLDSEQKKQAISVKKEVEKKFGKIYTEILPSTQFYPAEDYHQNYSQKKPLWYKYYRHRCERDKGLVDLWGSGN